MNFHALIFFLLSILVFDFDTNNFNSRFDVNRDSIFLNESLHLIQLMHTYSIAGIINFDLIMSLSE